MNENETWMTLRKSGVQPLLSPSDVDKICADLYDSAKGGLSHSIEYVKKEVIERIVSEFTKRNHKARTSHQC